MFNGFGLESLNSELDNSADMSLLEAKMVVAFVQREILRRCNEAQNPEVVILACRGLA